MTAGGPRVLLSAYQCAPDAGSVSQIGWEWFVRLSRRLPVTLMTHVRNRQAISEAAGSAPSPAVVYVDTEWLAGPLHALSRAVFRGSEHPVFMVSSVDFFAFDRVALRMLQRRHERGERFDLLHIVTPVSPVLPSRLHHLGVPVVRGPLNGGLRSLVPFRRLARRERRLSLLGRIGGLLDRLWGSSRGAACVLTATSATRTALPSGLGARCRPMLDIGVDVGRFTPAPWPPDPSVASPLRVAFVGRLVDIKGLPLLVSAIRRIRCDVPVSLEIVGDGPRRGAWERLVAAHGLGSAVRFLGALPAAGVAEAMRRAHVLCLPSVHESGGAVLLEAMACGRPAIVIRHGGPGELIDDAVGCAVTPADPAAVIDGIADALRDVVRAPARWRARGLAARRLAERRYDWERKIDEALRPYDEVLAS